MRRRSTTPVCRRTAVSESRVCAAEAKFLAAATTFAECEGGDGGGEGEGCEGPDKKGPHFEGAVRKE